MFYFIPFQSRDRSAGRHLMAAATQDAWTGASLMSCCIYDFTGTKTPVAPRKRVFMPPTSANKIPLEDEGLYTDVIMDAHKQEVGLFQQETAAGRTQPALLFQNHLNTTDLLDVLSQDLVPFSLDGRGCCCTWRRRPRLCRRPSTSL